MPAFGQTAFGQNRNRPKKSEFGQVTFVTAFGQNRIWPELVFLVFWPCVCCVCVVCVVSSRFLVNFWCVFKIFGGCFQDFWASPPDRSLLERPLPWTAPPDPPLLDRSSRPPKISLLFFSLPPEMSSFLLSLGGLLVDFFGFLKAGTLKCARLGSLVVV